MTPETLQALATLAGWAVFIALVVHGASNRLGVPFAKAAQRINVMVGVLMFIGVMHALSGWLAGLLVAGVALALYGVLLVVALVWPTEDQAVDSAAPRRVGART
jgi:hypothetical protein